MADSISWKQRIFRAAGYVAFTLAVYLLALWFFLPYDELARRVESALHKQDLLAEVRGLGPGPLFGFKADTVALAPALQPDLRLRLADAQVQPLFTRLLRGERTVGMRTGTLGGSVDATLQWLQKPALQAHWESLELAQVPLPEIVEGLPLTGQVSGSLSAELDRVSPARSSGVLSLEMEGVKIGAGTVQGIPLPEVSLGRGIVDVASGDGKVEIRKLEFEDGDLGLTFTGTLLVREDLERSLLNGVLSLQPNEKAAQDLALLFALFPSEKGSDGRYTARVRGSLGSPRLLKR